MRHSSLSLFTGAGGLDIGLETAGFEVVLCVEDDNDCRKTIRHNWPSWKLSEPVMCTNLRPRDLMRQAGVRKRDLTLLAGGPPCQPFSKSGLLGEWRSATPPDPRALTLNAYLSIIEESLPLIFVLENVKVLYSTKKTRVCATPT